MISGVDQHDQLMSTSGKRHHKALKWYKACFYRSLEWAAVNVFILYRETLNGVDRKRFNVSAIKRLLVRDLIEFAGVRKQPIPRAPRVQPSIDDPVCHRRFSQGKKI